MQLGARQHYLHLLANFAFEVCRGNAETVSTDLHGILMPKGRQALLTNLGLFLWSFRYGLPLALTLTRSAKRDDAQSPSITEPALLRHLPHSLPEPERLSVLLSAGKWRRE